MGVASYVFYGWWDWRFSSLILFSTLVDFTVGIRLSKEESKAKRDIVRAERERTRAIDDAEKARVETEAYKQKTLMAKDELNDMMLKLEDSKIEREKAVEEQERKGNLQEGLPDPARKPLSSPQTPEVGRRAASARALHRRCALCQGTFAWFFQGAEEQKGSSDAQV